MATDLEKRAKAAFVDDDFELAVGLYGQAIELDPNNADLFADRAQAYIKLGSFTGTWFSPLEAMPFCVSCCLDDSFEAFCFGLVFDSLFLF